MSKTQRIAAKEYTAGRLSFDELMDTLGYEDAKKIAYYKGIAEASFVEGL